LRVRFLRTACPACWLLDVSRLIASRMVFRAQGESPAPRSWKRRATCSRRVVRRVCSELIMWYRKLTILDRISKRHSRPLDFPLAPLARLELPSRAPRTSLSRASNFPLARLELPSRAPRDFPFARLELPSRAPRDFPLARLATRVGLSNRGSKSEWAHGGRGSLTPLGPAPLARRPRRVPLAGARRPPRLPLGGRATTVRAPLPVGYLPIELWQLTRLTGQPLGAGKHRVSPLALRARWSCPRGERRARKTMSTFFLSFHPIIHVPFCCTLSGRSTSGSLERPQNVQSSITLDEGSRRRRALGV